MQKYIFPVVLLTLLAEQILASEITFPEIRMELLEMVKVDQAMRSGEIRVDDFVEIDGKNTQRLEEIVKEIGWPTSKLVGEDGSGAAWLLAQHADHKPEFQSRILQLLEPLVDSGEVKGSHYAYLYDRTHHPQRFGTQGNCTGREWEPREIEDTSELEVRREKYGMSTFTEYKKMATDRLCSN